jgi:hypothetical protein
MARQQTLLRITWNPKFAGVYYVTIRGRVEYEVEVNDDWEISFDRSDPEIADLIEVAVSYFVNKRRLIEGNDGRGN